MGFIPNSATKKLTAYHTQKGREYIVSGDKAGFDIAYFALSDSDVNYLVSANPTASADYNMLEGGQVPDISGDHEGAIHSLAGGVNQRHFAFGGPNVTFLGTAKELGLNRTALRWQSTVLDRPLQKTSTEVQTLSFTLPLEQFGGAITGFERAKVYVLPPSQGTSPAIYNGLTTNVNNSGGLIAWEAGDVGLKDIPVTLTTNLLTGSYVAKFKVVPYQSALSLDEVRSVITVTISLTSTLRNNVSITNTVSLSETIGNNTTPPIFVPVTLES